MRPFKTRRTCDRSITHSMQKGESRRNPRPHSCLVFLNFINMKLLIGIPMRREQKTKKHRAPPDCARTPLPPDPVSNCLRLNKQTVCTPSEVHTAQPVLLLLLMMNVPILLAVKRTNHHTATFIRSVDKPCAIYCSTDLYSRRRVFHLFSSLRYSPSPRW